MTKTTRDATPFTVVLIGANDHVEESYETPTVHVIHIAAVNEDAAVKGACKQVANLAKLCFGKKDDMVVGMQLKPVAVFTGYLKSLKSNLGWRSMRNCV
jgi:hypothetical protein